MVSPHCDRAVTKTMVDHLLTVLKALSFIPRTREREKKNHAFNLLMTKY